ncbi:FixH family protein [Halobacillus litoralis]|uniref:FixH family protein n=1 Tax=Halobacillus litoralis TaxID=45668 RepID=UPI001CD44F1E|nr:FixH family protein [Halobacillus litoralis]MCA0970554.1 FixH family protein [Halobacillus litoralis]
MKKKYLWMMLAVVGILVFSACGSSDAGDESETASGEDALPLPIEVEISTEPGLDALEVGESFTIQAKVTQGDELVSDADDVQFEFWKKDQDSEEHDMVDGEPQGEGIYSIEKQVEEADVYYVVAHVTARDMHNMPKQELVIGDVAQEELQEAEEHHNEEEGHDHSHEGDHSHATDVMTHIMLEDLISKGEETRLMAHVMNGEAPVSEAEVRFEVWKDGAEKHMFLDAEETENQGEYALAHTFEESGTYQVKLHVVKGDLHTHKEKSITVE